MASKLGEKKLLSFSVAADKWLRAEAKELGIAVTELIRRIVDEKRLMMSQESALAARLERRSR